MTTAVKDYGIGSRPHVVVTIILFVMLASLDNAAIMILPSILLTVSEDLNVATSLLGWVTASVLLVTALTAVAWGYWGDRSNRKWLLIAGTLEWSLGSWFTAQAITLPQLWAAQAFAAIGLGAIASIGFSTISDFVAPSRRGLAMSFWGLSQGAGSLFGGLYASQVGATDWRRPFISIAALGALAGCAYVIAYEPIRGRSEPELAGAVYDFRIERSDLPAIAAIRSNRWLIAQGVTAQLAYGALIWVPLLYQSKVQAEGYDIATSTQVGGIFAALFQVAAIASIGAGYLGDRWQSKNLRGRALLSMIGILGAIPFFLGFFFVPLQNLAITPGASTMANIYDILTSIIQNPWVGAAFGLSVCAAILTSADSPNWFALIADVNLPEHRGTVFGAANLANGIGRSAGNALTGLTAASLLTWFAAPLNYAIGLAVFQLFFIPTGYAYWKVSRTAEVDIMRVTKLLRARSRQS
jgi:MFS family permease